MFYLYLFAVSILSYYSYCKINFYRERREWD